MHKTMEVEQALHMTGGSGENSYANNSRVQEEAINKTKPVVEEAIREICNTILQDNLVVADLGCASSPNTILVISEIIDVVVQHCGRHQPEIQFFLNDLPGNDFNNIFQQLMPFQKQFRDDKGAKFVPFYVVGLPGSFYERLFPTKSVHFFHSSYCLMWLSQVPRGLQDEKCAELNNGNIYIPDACPSILSDLYVEQYKRDFTKFLNLRSKELLFGGSMILSFLGRRNYPENGELFHLWGLLGDALNAMVSEGLVEEAKLNAFNLPFYAPLMEEVKSVIEMEGSFLLDQAQSFESNWDPFDNSTDDFVIDNSLSGENVAKYIRAVVEPLLAHHFGYDIIDDLFSRYAKNVARHMLTKKAKFVIFVLVLKLKG